MGKAIIVKIIFLLASAVLFIMAGWNMIIFYTRPEIVPTGPMGVIHDPVSLFMGILLTVCAVLIIAGIIFIKKLFGNILSGIALLIGLVPVVWGYLIATAIYLDKNLVLISLIMIVVSIISIVQGLFYQARKT